MFQNAEVIVLICNAAVLKHNQILPSSTLISIFIYLTIFIPEFLPYFTSFANSELLF